MREFPIKDLDLSNTFNESIALEYDEMKNQLTKKYSNSKKVREKNVIQHELDPKVKQDIMLREKRKAEEAQRKDEYERQRQIEIEKQEQIEASKKEFDRNDQAHTTAAPGTPFVIESNVDGEFEGWEGETIVKLINGQIWLQTEYHYHYHYAYMPGVLIYKSGAGWKMKVEGVKKAVQVERLK